RATDAEPLRIAFPPAGATVELPPDSAGRRPTLVLTAAGGAPPYRWVINGQPLAADPLRPTASWAPDGAGYTDIVVIDRSGDSAARTVLIR
ncbi:MAG: penicillin-binding protein 1C, partial [Alphaproteobacteria bacterium]|nr:penicillin-binding protein 1C [Alphaproteobacteria bacterium]